MAVGSHGVIKGEGAARLQDAPDFAVELLPVADVHHHMLCPHGVETPLVKGQVGQVTDHVADPVGQLGSSGEQLCHFDE